MSPFTTFPLPKVQRDTMVFHRPARLLKHKRFKLMTTFAFRLTPKFRKESHIRSVNPSQLFLNRLAWQRFPMRVGRSFQVRQMCGHGIVVGIRQSVPIPFVLPSMEIVMHLPHIVKQIADTDTIRLIAELVFIRFHSISSVKSLTPNQWVGNRHVTLRLRWLCLPT